jgi:hypothetical protein
MASSIDADTYVNPIEILDTSPSNSSTACLMLYGGMTIYNTQPSFSITEGGGITCLGGASILADSIFGNKLAVRSTAQSTSADTGAFTVNGGIGTVSVYANNGTVQSLQTNTVTSTHATIASLTSTVISADTLASNNVNFTNETVSSLLAVNATIANLTATVFSAGTLAVSNVNFTNETVGSLLATNASIASLQATNEIVTNETISNLIATSITTGTLDAATRVCTGNIVVNSSTGGTLLTVNGRAQINSISMFTNSVAERLVLAGNAQIGILGGPNYVSFLGTTGKSSPVSSGATYLGERDYNTGTTTASELLLFKGWNPAGPDRIRHFAPSHQFDTYTSTITTGGFDTIGNLASTTRALVNSSGLFAPVATFTTGSFGIVTANTLLVTGNTSIGSLLATNASIASLASKGSLLGAQ